MKIQDLLQKNAMILSLNATNKADAISEMVQKLVDTGYVTDFDTFKDGILAREALTTTGLGEGIAMPHSKNAAVKEAVVLFAKKDGGLDYESLDGQPTDLFFMIAAPIIIVLIFLSISVEAVWTELVTTVMLSTSER